MLRILLAEDDKRLGNLLVHMLNKEQYHIDWVINGDDALDYAIAAPYDLIVLDWMMPGMDGTKVCQNLRKNGCNTNTPVLMLTARDALDDKVEGLDAGADDYLVKPFEFKELLARLRALSRRARDPVIEDLMQAADFTLDRVNRLLIRGGSQIPLTLREFQLLELLMINRGQTLPRELIIDRVWGYDTEVTANNLDAFIRLLRKKIGDTKHRRHIQNIRGVGYRFDG